MCVQQCPRKAALAQGYEAAESRLASIDICGELSQGKQGTLG